MKKTLLLIIFNLLLINPKILRDLILSITPEDYTVLSEAAKNTVLQLYNKNIDFNGSTDCVIEDSKQLLLKVVLLSTQDIPTEEVQAYFDISNYKYILPEITYPNLKFDIFGGTQDLEEEFKGFADKISTAFKNGKFYTYKKIGENAAQTRFKCFVNSDEGTSHGSFEIVQQDKNDEATILEKIADWYFRVKEVLTTVTNEVKAISELLATWKGIVKDLNSTFNSSFLINIHLFLLLILFLLL